MAQLRSKLILELASLEKLLNRNNRLILIAYKQFCQRVNEDTKMKIPKSTAVLLSSFKESEVFLFTDQFDSMILDIEKRNKGGLKLIELGIISTKSPLWLSVQPKRIGESVSLKNDQYKIVCMTKPLISVWDYTNSSKTKETKKSRSSPPERKKSKVRTTRSTTLTDEERQERKVYYNEISMPIGLGRKR